MSDISKSALLTGYPSVLSEDMEQGALGAITAELLSGCFISADYARIYANINRLDSKMLDILAYDFKIDWWDVNASVEEKRKTFADHWTVHKHKGTPGAVRTAVQAIYPSTQIVEGEDLKPYHYKISIELQDEFPNTDKIESIVQRASYYANLRSVLDIVEVSTTSRTAVYVGLAIDGGQIVDYTVSGLDLDDYTIITDELGELLTDDAGNALIL